MLTNQTEMKETSKEIMKLIVEYLEKNPCQRFGQALYNLGVNEDDGKWKPDNGEIKLRDIFYDTDEAVLERIRARIKKFGF